MCVRYNKINITFPARVIVENIIPRNMIINLGCASVDNHIPRDDIFDYHPLRECNFYIILVYIQREHILDVESILYVEEHNCSLKLDTSSRVHSISAKT